MRADLDVRKAKKPGRIIFRWSASLWHEYQQNQLIKPFLIIARASTMAKWDLSNKKAYDDEKGLIYQFDTKGRWEQKQYQPKQNAVSGRTACFVIIAEL